MSTFAVAVPEGAAPGTTLQVVAPNGVSVQVQVPAGAAPGSTFNVGVPSTVTTTTTTTTAMADPNYIDLRAGCDPCGKFGAFLLTIMPIPFAPSIALSVTPYGCVGGKVSPVCVPPTKPNTLGNTRCVLGNTRSARWKHSCARTGDTFCSRPHHPFPHQAKIITYGTLISWVCVVVGVGGIMVSRVRRLECVSFLRELCSNSLLRRPTVCVRFSRDDATRSIPALSATISISHHPSPPSAGPNLATRLDDLGVDPHLRAP